MQQFPTFRDFWPFYLQEHARPFTRALHYAGTSLVLILFLTALLCHWLRPLALLPFAGYGFAWVAHWFVERNQPATFRYPLWSLAADWLMWFRFLTGRIGDDLMAAGVRPDGSIDPARRL